MSFLSPQDTIWEATRRGDLEAVRQFIERDGVPDVEDDYDQQSLLTVACAAGHVDVVRYLWQQGRPVIIVGRAPEAFAAMENGHLNVLRLLCELGLDPDSTRYSKHGQALIDAAIEQRRAEVVRLLIEHGGYIDSEYENEATIGEREGHDNFPSPLELAARAGDLEFVAFLLDVGVDLQGQTPNYYLLKARHNEPKYERVQKDEVERALRSRLSADSDTYGEGGPLFCGCTFFLLGLLFILYLFEKL